jgi:hypothetical protein
LLIGFTWCGAIRSSSFHLRLESCETSLSWRLFNCVTANNPLKTRMFITLSWKSYLCSLRKRTNRRRSLRLVVKVATERVRLKSPSSSHVIPAQAGNQLTLIIWFPACAGMTKSELPINSGSYSQLFAERATLVRGLFQQLIKLKQDEAGGEQRQPADAAAQRAALQTVA